MKKRRLLAITLTLALTLSILVPVSAVTGVTGIAVTGKKTVYVGKTIELDSVISPGYIDIEDRNIVWSSNKPKVVKVLEKRDDEIKVKGVKAGKATITVRVEGTNIKATYKVTVKKAKKKKTGAAAAKKTINNQKKKAKAIKADIKSVKLASTYSGRVQQYRAFESRIDAIDNKLDRLDDTWEDKYDYGKVTYKTYKSVDRKIESVDNYLETVDEYLDAKFNYEFDD